MEERHYITISGKDSLAAALIQTTRYPDLPYTFLYCDVKAELPETYQWLDKVEQSTGWKIHRIGKSLPDLIKRLDMIPSANRRFCTSRAKIGPMERWYGKGRNYVYYGLRADEQRPGVRPSDTTIPIYPLMEAGIDLRGVWIILNRRGLLPPAFFWPSLYYKVCEMLGDKWELIDELEPWEQRMLFAGRTRANCSFCFYQRYYEWVWLAETHPPLFEQAVRLERFTGRLQQAPFTWIYEAGHIDNFIRNNRARLLKKRAQEVCQMIRKRLDGGLFGEHGETELALTSCGLLCGK